MATTKTIKNHSIDISNVEKVIYSDDGITKGDIIDYYEKIANQMLPFLKDRPLMMQRFPNGIEDKGFYQKDRPDYFPDWIQSSKVKKKEGGKVDHVLCNDAATLVYLANQACITYHGWLSLADTPEKPDKLVVDIDPSGEDLSQLRKAMRVLKDFFSNSGMKSFPMTTGSSGYHIIVPIQAKRTFEKIKSIADSIANKIAEDHPDLFTTAARKEKRGSAIYLDVQRNAYAQTSVIPYSLRAKKGAPVAAPLDWEEAISSDMEPQKYTIKNIFNRLGQRDDVWTEFFHKKISEKNNDVLDDWS